MSDGTFELVNQQSGQCLYSNGLNQAVFVGDCAQGATRSWRTGSGGSLRDYGGGCLDLGMTSGLVTSTCAGEASQRWTQNQACRQSPSPPAAEAESRGSERCLTPVGGRWSDDRHERRSDASRPLPRRRRPRATVDRRTVPPVGGAAGREMALRWHGQRRVPAGR
ncbi:ricin-type beta-trefoil lectin domain protein [Streptomyces sp. A1136]|uniref:ricin-type beta-trefoil lectin domain protein n=1 Tax=Streptomyces sp. A1136 TaxID=2563102 RepID=UPI00109EC13A|nr:ricin-type beta-trefoil lectin domain protein [Streptomyces sp. A1136]THA51452.1 hypothetical protein E6R62_23405 [Streptomyces sp. A1136]